MTERSDRNWMWFTFHEWACKVLGHKPDPRYRVSNCQRCGEMVFRDGPSDRH